MSNKQTAAPNQDGSIDGAAMIVRALAAEHIKENTTNVLELISRFNAMKSGLSIWSLGDHVTVKIEPAATESGVRIVLEGSTDFGHAVLRRMQEQIAL